jgi:hypothetical protein
VNNCPYSFIGGIAMGFHKNIKRRIYDIKRESEEIIENTFREIEEITNRIIEKLEEDNVQDNKFKDMGR